MHVSELLKKSKIRVVNAERSIANIQSHNSLSIKGKVIFFVIIYLFNS